MPEYVIQGINPMPKKRPQRTRWGGVRMPEEYQEYKRAVRDYLAAQYSPEPILGPCSLEIELRAPNRPRGDLDNLAGGLMDAIQPPSASGDVRAQRALVASTTLEERLQDAPGCLIADDKQINDLRVRWVRVTPKHRAIVLRIEEMPCE